VQKRETVLSWGGLLDRDQPVVALARWILSVEQN
jgi:hypothetical protein